jgi:hypothetical protein
VDRERSETLRRRGRARRGLDWVFGEGHYCVGEELVVVLLVVLPLLQRLLALLNDVLDDFG